MTVAASYFVNQADLEYPWTLTPYLGTAAVLTFPVIELFKFRRRFSRGDRLRSVFDECQRALRW